MHSTRPQRIMNNIPNQRTAKMCHKLYKKVHAIGICGECYTQDCQPPKKYFLTPIHTLLSANICIKVLIHVFHRQLYSNNRTTAKGIHFDKKIHLKKHHPPHKKKYIYT